MKKFRSCCKCLDHVLSKSSTIIPKCQKNCPVGVYLLGSGSAAYFFSHFYCGFRNFENRISGFSQFSRNFLLLKGFFSSFSTLFIILKNQSAILKKTVWKKCDKSACGASVLRTACGWGIPPIGGPAGSTTGPSDLSGRWLAVNQSAVHSHTLPEQL